MSCRRRNVVRFAVALAVVGGLGSVVSLSVLSLMVAGRLVSRAPCPPAGLRGRQHHRYSRSLMASLSPAAVFWTALWSRFGQGIGMGLIFVGLTTQRLYGEVQRHTAMIVFLDNFWLLRAVFVAVVPVLWGMGRYRRGAGEAEALPAVGAG